MTANCKALEPQLIRKINGTNTFSFKIYYTYINEETGEREIWNKYRPAMLYKFSNKDVEIVDII